MRRAKKGKHEPSPYRKLEGYLYKRISYTTGEEFLGGKVYGYFVSIYRNKNKKSKSSPDFLLRLELDSVRYGVIPSEVLLDELINLEDDLGELLIVEDDDAKIF